MLHNNVFKFNEASGCPDVVQAVPCFVFVLMQPAEIGKEKENGQF